VRNENEIKPSILQLESLRSELIEKTLNTNSNFLRLLLYQNYFNKTLSLNNPNLEEAFLKEFIEDYLSSIQKYEAFGTNPKFTDELLQQLKRFAPLTFIKDILPALTSEIDRIEHQVNRLNLILKGMEYREGIEYKAFFPLIDKEAPDNFYGIIESVTIRINKTTENDKFIIVPSEKEIEKNISEQCKNSWLLAVDILKKYVKKPYHYHEVIISFDKKEGFYEGNSFGIALTLSFLEELLKFYNPTYVIKIKGYNAFTGGIDEDGGVLNIGEEVIQQKIKAIFFSEVNTFVVPKLEETYAYFALTQLRNQYPQRKLKLIPAIDICDVLNRRDLVEIKKINPVVRTGKFVKKNWLSAAAIVLLAILFAFLFAMDFDHNPVSYSSDKRTIYLKNKNGKVLWEKDLYVDYRQNDQRILQSSIKIVDINDDGLNEVLLVGEKIERQDSYFEQSILRCYDAFGKFIWKYSFIDQVTSEREVLNTEYGVKILDTLFFNGEHNLYLSASNGPSFSSAIFRIDLITGKRLKGTFWASGHIMDGTIKDIDNDNISEMIGVGYDNGFEDLVFFVYEIDTLTKVRPTTESYQIRNYPIADMKAYIRFPKTDFDNYNKVRTPGYNIGSFHDNQSYKKFIFGTSLLFNPYAEQLGYEIRYNLKDINIVISSDFRVQRDTLVAQGKLNPPYTDTREYVELQKSKILYWQDGRWVKRKELEK
jgi:hypothetical protein